MPQAVICDDDRVARRVIGAMVEAHGFEVVSEVDLAIDAIRVVEACRPDLLVMDVSMPGMSGVEALQTVARVSPGTKVVIASAYELAATGEQLDGAYALVDKANLDRLEDILVALARDAGTDQ